MSEIEIFYDVLKYLGISLGILLFFMIIQPFLHIIIIILCSFYFYLYKKMNHNNRQITSEFWNKPVKKVAKLWSFIGYIFHGYEIEGLENIPKDKPALIIFFHSPGLLDFFCAASNILLKTNRKIKPIVAKLTFEIKGLQSWCEATEGFPGSIETCVECLNDNNLLAISPGGMREQFLSDDYELLWAKRKGFAKVAIEAKVPIILLFTRNCQQINKTIRIFPNFFRDLFEKRNIQVPLLFGWFPVKLKTYISSPIEYDENIDVDELVTLVKEKMRNFIDEHQKRNNWIISAIIERFKRIN